MIPLLDLKKQYAAIQKEADEAVTAVLSGGSYIMGENVRAFEKEFAAYLGVKHAVSAGNGTDALVIALEALGIGAGDEVITTPFTFFATAEAISQVGAVPVFADVRPDTYNLDETKIEAKITPRTKAILPVHIFGQCAEMEAIWGIARRHGLRVIEDACQAAGSRYRGKMAGALADISCFSFFPTKNLGCAGDGGMLCTDSEELAIICRALRAHGSGEAGEQAWRLLRGEAVSGEALPAGDATVYQPKKYFNYLIGHNSRLDEVQAALLRVKLRHLPEYIESRQALAHRYDRELSGSALTLPAEAEGCSHAYHLYIVQSGERDRVTAALREAGVATGVYYPVPLHLQKCYQPLGYAEGSLPVAEYLSGRTFAIPLYPEMPKQDQDAVIAAVNRVCR